MGKPLVLFILSLISTLLAVSCVTVQDHDEFGAIRACQQSGATILGLKFRFESWTVRTRDPSSPQIVRISHTALMTVGNALLCKILWELSCDERLLEESAVSEVVDVTICSAAIRRMTLENMVPNLGSNKEEAMWNLFILLAMFSVHVGPRSRFYCVADFIEGLRKEHDAAQRNCSKRFAAHRKLSRSASGHALVEGFPLDEETGKGSLTPTMPASE
jgi:hypothetical protein